MSLPSRFVKMAGGGNDFLVFEADGRRLTEEDRRRLALVCRRGLSVGADGALFLSPDGPGRVRIDYFNSDGGAATFCANGTRCAARYAIRHKLASGPSLVLETGWGPIAARVEGDLVTLALPAVPAPQDPVPISGRGLPPTAIPMKVGVPHLVVFMRGDLSQLPIERLGPARPPASGHAGRRERQLRPGRQGQPHRGPHLGARRGGGDALLRLRRRRRGDRGRPGGPRGLARDLRDPKSGVDLVVEFSDEKDAFTGVRLTGDAREVYAGELLEEAWQA